MRESRKTKKAPEEGPLGIDRWTSNGYGITVSPPTPEQQKAIDELNAELDSEAHTHDKE